jgi:hypothetical protein
MSQRAGGFPARGLYLTADPSYIPGSHCRPPRGPRSRGRTEFERSAPMRAETEAKAQEIKQSLALLRRSL